MPFTDKGVVMLDLNGRILFASTYFCDLVGIEHDKIDRKSCFDFVFPEDLEEAKRRFEASKLPHVKPFRFRVRRVDGTGIWTNIQGAALQTAGGAVYAITATITSAEKN